MSNDFMERCLTLWIIYSVAIFPLEIVWAIAKLFAKIADTEVGDLPDGCAATMVVLTIMSLIAAPFIAWWCYHNFHVVWK